MKSVKLHDGVFRIEAGDWIIHTCNEDAHAINKNTGEFFSITRETISDLVNGLSEVKRQMIVENHG